MAILAAKFLAPQGFLELEGNSQWSACLTLLIPLFTGIYAIVRGLDNIITEIRKPSI
jgi:hypothetical protein